MLSIVSHKQQDFIWRWVLVPDHRKRIQSIVKET